MQKHANLVDLVKSFPANIFLQNLASIQKRTSPIKFVHLAEKSEKDSISNLSIEAQARRVARLPAGAARLRPPCAAVRRARGRAKQANELSIFLKMNNFCNVTMSEISGNCTQDLARFLQI